MGVTRKPEVFQSSLGPTNLPDNTVLLKNVTTGALQIYYQNIKGLRWKSSEVLDFLYPNLPHILCFVMFYVSLTSFSKITEKLIYARVHAHIDTNNILIQEQYGFWTHSSTEQGAFTLINCILTAMNNSQMVGGIFCDLQKAFNCINHKILLEKLEFYGVEGKFKTLIESHLTGKYQRVALNNITNNNSSSKWELLKCGMPRGSILGPLFFLIYINDLPTIVNNNNNMVLFADDTSIIITDTHQRDFNINANQTFQDINTWFKVNLLTLNLNKTQYLEFRTKNYYNVNTQI
jgi:hypothetical protein